MTHLPPLYTCRFCGAGVEPGDPQTYRRVSGWVQNRKPATVVGVTGELGFACPLCIGNLKLKVNPDQTALF